MQEWALLASKKVSAKEVGNIAGYAAIGIILVFVVLAVIMGFIYLIGFASRGMDKLEKNEGYQKFKAAFKIKKKEVQELAPGSTGDLVLEKTTEREVAMIMAIVADQLETPINQLKFKSIKQISEEEK